MSALRRSGYGVGLALALTACGGPTTPPLAPKAAAPTAPVADPKGTIDAAKSAAAEATAAIAARQAPATDGKPDTPITSAGTVAATTAATALVPAAPKYDPEGRRDPFESLEARLGSDHASVRNAKLTGVIHSGGVALALVETSDGIGYILKAGDTLADGRLIEIGPTAAVFSIPPKPGTTTNRVVLRLASD
jgi:hypothetical protein